MKQTEIRLGILIPEPYRTFLLSNNGGQPEPNGIDIAGLPGEETNVQTFVAVKDEDESNTIEFNLEILREGYPHKNVLPVALDSFGGIFCLDLGEGKGIPVVYSEWGGAWKSEPYEPLRVAADFGAFLDMMHQ
jgi:hypothetical protein